MQSCLKRTYLEFAPLLPSAQVRLLQRVFAGCSRVVVTKLHGGFSGSLVLKTDSYDREGRRDEPTVTKLDDAESLRDEVERTRRIATLAEQSVAQVQRDPLFVDAAGEPKVAGDATAEDFGCVVLDMAGACWVMPEFYGKLDHCATGRVEDLETTTFAQTISHTAPPRLPLRRRLGRGRRLRRPCHRQGCRGCAVRHSPRPAPRARAAPPRP